MLKMEKIHKNKKYMALFYDKLETLIENFSNEEIGLIIRAAALYELYGETTELNERALQIALRGIYTDINLSTEKANETSQKQRERALARWNKDNSYDMTSEEMDAEIDRMFPKGKYKP